MEILLEPRVTMKSVLNLGLHTEKIFEQPILFLIWNVTFIVYYTLPGFLDYIQFHWSVYTPDRYPSFNYDSDKIVLLNGWASLLFVITHFLLDLLLGTVSIMNGYVFQLYFPKSYC